MENESNNERMKRRYREDPEYRAKCLATSKAWYHAHKKKKVREKVKTLDMKEYHRRYYEENKERIKLNRYMREQRKQRKDGV